jgi:hypothetical protein
MKKLTCILLFLFAASAAYPSGRLEFGAGGAFYADAVGLNLNLGYSRSLSDWAKAFASGAGTVTLFSERFYLGLGATVNIVPRDFSVYTFDFEIRTGYQVRLSDLTEISFPLALYPYLNIGTPLNLFSNGGGSTANGGVMFVPGLKIGFLLAEGKFDAGFGVEYQANLTGYFIGSIGLYAYGAFIL